MELHRSPGRTCGRLLRDDAGQGLVEYAIIISIVVAATYAALSRLSAHVEAPVGRAACAMDPLAFGTDAAGCVSGNAVPYLPKNY